MSRSYVVMVCALIAFWTTGAAAVTDAEKCEAAKQTILLAPFPCGTNPCIDPIFDPTQTGSYWSASTYAPDPMFAWGVYFGDGYVHTVMKPINSLYVRAVRGSL